MTQFNNKISQIPTDYPFRYTLDYHIRLVGAITGMGIMDVVKDILNLLEVAEVGLSERQFHRYRIEEKDSIKEELSYERRLVITEYIKDYTALSDPDLLITANIHTDKSKAFDPSVRL